MRTVNGQPQQTEVPTHYSGIMEFVNGAVGTVTMSFDVWDSSLPLEIFGTDGSLSVPDPNMFCGEITAFNGKKLTDMVNSVTDPHPAKLMTMVTKKVNAKKLSHHYSRQIRILDATCVGLAFLTWLRLLSMAVPAV